MKRKKIIDRIASIPAWGISLIAAVSVSIFSGIFSGSIGQPLSYVIYSLLLVFASFLICILHPKHVWIVPLLCNIFVIFPALLDDSFWTIDFGLIMGLGVVFSETLAP